MPWKGETKAIERTERMRFVLAALNGVAARADWWQNTFGRQDVERKVAELAVTLGDMAYAEFKKDPHLVAAIDQKVKETKDDKKKGPAFSTTTSKLG